MKLRLVLMTFAGFLSCRPEARVAAQTLSGTVVLVAPIVGASVQVVRLDGNPGEVIGRGVTDEEGNYTIELVDTVGAALVEVTGEAGGATKEPLSQKQLRLSLTDSFAAIVTDLKLGHSKTNVVVSPWSTLIAARARWDIETNGRTVADALARSTDLFVQHFGERSFFDSKPVDPTNGVTNGLSTGSLHGFVTTALAMMGMDMSRRLQLTPSSVITTLSLTQWLADDLRGDGVFNNRGRDGQPINIIDEQGLDKELTRAQLGAALGTFITSPDNKSGIGLRDLTAIITSMSTDASPLYEGTAGAQSEGPGPTISLVSPANGEEYRDKVIVVGQVESEVGVAGVELALDGQALGGGGVRVSTTKVIWTVDAPVDDGFHTLAVTARDASGQASQLTITFNSDKTAPVLLFASCKAVDDRLRIAKATFTTGQVDWGQVAWDPSCTLPALTTTEDDESMTLHSFAELAKRSETASVVAIVPEDRGQVFTEQNKVLVVASIYRGEQQVGHDAIISVAPGDASVREIPISGAAFGDELLNVDAGAKLELRIAATDRQGNQITSSYSFFLDLLPTPLAVAEQTPNVGSARRVESYGFAAGNADSVFDPALPIPFGLFVAGEYLVKNVSDRTIAFQVAEQNAGTLTAIVREWTGMVAAQKTTWGLPNNWGYQSSVTTAPTRAELTNPPLDDLYSNCFNTAASFNISQESLPSSIVVLARSDGAESCRTPEELRTTESLFASAAWHIVATNASTGVPLPLSASGEYSLSAGATGTVTIAFDIPRFQQRDVRSCAPLYRDEVFDGTLLLSSPDFQQATVSTFKGLLLPRSVYGTATATYPNLSWTGRAWVDCTGFACTGPGCRTDDDQVMLRAQGSIQYSDFRPVGGPWQRRAERRAAAVTLSRMHLTLDYSVDGTFAVSTSSRLPTNANAFDSTFDLKTESFSVHHSSANPSAPPDHPIRYTKGLLP